MVVFGPTYILMVLQHPKTFEETRNIGMSMLLSDLENWKNYKEWDEDIPNKNQKDIRDGNARVYQAQEDFSSMIVSVLQIKNKV